MTFTFTPATKEAARAYAPLRRIEATPLADRLMSKVQITESGCWEWTGYRMPNGYGQIRTPEGVRLAHRVSASLWSPLADLTGREVDHLCRNRGCVNPWHLEPVTGATNRARQGAAVTHCPAGHPYTPENTYTAPSSPRERRCRTCARERQRRSAQ